MGTPSDSLLQNHLHPVLKAMSGAVGCSPKLCGQSLCDFYEALCSPDNDSLLQLRHLAHPPAPSLVAWWGCSELMKPRVVHFFFSAHHESHMQFT